MKTAVRLLTLLAFLVLGGTTARASHAAGGQITYEYIGTAAQPNLYRITCLLLSNCPATFPATVNVNCRVGAPGTACATQDPRNTYAALAQVGSTISTLYCPSVGNSCGQMRPGSYSTTRYIGTVELPPAPAWTLSVVENARETLANISGATDMYLETTLSNQLVLPDGTTQTVRSSSPLVPTQTPLAYAAADQQFSSLNFTAYDADGDSLVYSLAPALNGCNQPSTYKTAVGSGFFLIPGYSQNNPCLIGTTTQWSFTPTRPILSLAISGTCPVRVGAPFFTFNPRQGSFTFQPFRYDTLDVSNSRYVVVGKITEYRKINGRYYAIGSVRRDMTVAVISGRANRVPNPPVGSGSTASATAGTDSLVVEAGLLTTTTASFRFTDPNTGQLLTLSPALPTDAQYAGLYTNPAAPGVPVSITGNGTASPELQVRLRPDATVMGRTYRIPLQVEDNGCPVKGIHHYVLVLRATASPTATATQSGQSRGVVSAFPNPFTEQVSFTLPRPQAASVPVLDALGRVVAELPVPAGSSPEVQLTWAPAAAQPAGVYLVRVPSSGQTLRLLRR